MVVLGNSFARDFINMYEESELNGLYEIVYNTKGCGVSADELDSILGDAHYVVLASNWAQAEPAVVAYDKMERCVQRLEELLEGRKLFVLGAKNFGWNNNFVKLTDKESLFLTRTMPLQTVYDFNRLAVSSFENYIDLLGLIADAEGKVPVFTEDGKFITYDTNHLTGPGARFLAPKLFSKTALSALKEQTQNAN